MNTPTHILVAAAAFARPGRPRINAAAIVGGLLPDLGIYVLWVYARLAGIPERVVWREMYWSFPWKTLAAAGHAIPVYVAILALAGVLGAFGAERRHWWLAVLALSALMHIALDLPFHVDDAHPHFWPLSDWTFVSPLSYWDSNHHGGWVSAAEVVLGLVLTVILWRRFSSWWVRGPLLGALALYLLVPLYFTLMI